MKTKNFIALIVPVFLLLSSCMNHQRRIGGYYEFQSECLGVELDGSQTLAVWGDGRNRADAIEQAKKNGIRDVLFKGITSGKQECNAKPMLNEVNIQQKKEAYFNAFFADGGPYKDYITDRDGSDLHFEVVKTRKQAGSQEKYRVIIRVLGPKLKQKLIEDKILVVE